MKLAKVFEVIGSETTTNYFKRNNLVAYSISEGEFGKKIFVRGAKNPSDTLTAHVRKIVREEREVVIFTTNSIISLKDSYEPWERCNFEPIIIGSYKGVRYSILDGHCGPCCYIATKTEPLYVHGGVTYKGIIHSLEGSPEGYGWDYGHYKDYDPNTSLGREGKKWSSWELLREVYEAIESIL